MNELPELRREVRFDAGYDHRPDGRGCHGLQIQFLLHGPDGCVCFTMYTDWLPTHVKTSVFGPVVDRDKPEVTEIAKLMPMAADLGHHWRTPVYDGEEPREGCAYLDGARCFYDGSGLRAGNVMAALFVEGDAGVWKRLEQYYAECAR